MSDWWEHVSSLFVEPAQGWPKCEAGHDSHDRASFMVATPVSPIMIGAFDAMHYSDTPGYCPGDDDVSRTLHVTGMWEPIESQMFQETLQATPGVVLDIGAHLGWYSMIARQMGREVFAFEAVTEHIELWAFNCVDEHDKAHIVQAWIDGDAPHLPVDNAPDIAIVKIDIEGNERGALEMLWPLIKAGKVANILMEVSPVFNDGYPRLIRLLMMEGYTAEVCNPHLEFGMSEIKAVCAQFPQVDMMFRRQT